METTGDEIVKTIVISTFAVLILVVFTFMSLVLFIKKKKRLQAENQQLQADYAQALLEAQLEIQEQTLRHISREIHDNIGQILSLVSLNLHTIKAEDQEKVDGTVNLVSKAIADLRHISKTMNSDRVEHIGITDAIKQDLSQLDRSGQYTTVFTENAQLNLKEEHRVILYRMVQEVINNVLKHAEAYAIEIGIPDADTIYIADNGRGFDIEAANSNGIGLQNLYNRAKLINATTEISSSSTGTTVTFRINRS